MIVMVDDINSLQFIALTPIKSESLLNIYIIELNLIPYYVNTGKHINKIKPSRMI